MMSKQLNQQNSADGLAASFSKGSALVALVFICFATADLGLHYLRKVAKKVQPC